MTTPGSVRQDSSDGVAASLTGNVPPRRPILSWILRDIAVYVVVFAGLLLSRSYSYLLFHTLVETFSVAVAWSIFALTWNTRGYPGMCGRCMLIMGVGALCAGALDLVHMLAYKGMDIFVGYGANLPTQLWIAARAVQSGTLLAATAVAGRERPTESAPHGTRIVAICGSITIALLVAIFAGIFPDCYIEGSGLTTFKVWSEYVISVLFALSLVLLWRQRQRFAKPLLIWLTLSISLSIVSELCFTLYVGVYDALNLIGHLLKIAVFYALYRAIIYTGLSSPLEVLFGDLHNSERRYRTLVEHTDDMISRFDRDYRHLYASPSMARISPMGVDAVIGKSNRELGITASWVDLHEESIDRVFASGKSYSTEFSYGPPRATVTLNWQLIPEFDDEGNVVSVLSTARDVSESRRLERDYQQLFTSMDDGLAVHEIILDANGAPCDYRFLRVNPAFEQLTGLKSADLIGRTVLEVLPQTEPDWIRRYGHVALTGETDRFEMFSGSLDRFYDVTAYCPVPGQFATIFRDVTERRQGMMALQANRSLLAGLIESMPAPVFYKDAEGVYGGCNQAFADYLGKEKEQIVGKTVFDVSPGDLAATYHQADLDLMAAGEVQVYETEVLHADGARRHVVFHKAPFFDAAGDLQGLVGVMLDVTERKHTEEALQQSEVRFRSIVSAVGEGVGISDPEECFVYANPAAERIFGVGPGELVGRHTSEFMDAEQLQLVRSQTALRREGVSGSYELEIRRPDGQRRQLILTATPRTDGRGEFMGTFAVFRDVTELRRRETQRVEMMRQMLVTQKLESLGVLAGGVAHDFNNLLAVILGNLELAALDIPLDSPAVQCVDEAASAGQQAAELVRQLLAYTGQTPFLEERFSIARVVRGSAGLMNAAVPSGISLSLSLTDEDSAIKGDKSQMQQLLMGLVMNAAEAFEDDRSGEVVVGVEVIEADSAMLKASETGETVSPGRYVELMVRDNGTGMDAATRARIFEPFFSTKFVGRGLGLPAALGIVRTHQGGLWVESKEGHGTIVRVLLPFAQEESEQTQ